MDYHNQIDAYAKLMVTLQTANPYRHNTAAKTMRCPERNTLFE